MSNKKKRSQRVPGTKVRPLPEHKRVCLIVGDNGDPVVCVIRRDQLVHARDSGYTLYTSSAPEPAELTEDDGGSYCLACTRKAHPDAVRGMVLAGAYGGAYWDDDEGEWIAEDGDGNEIIFDSSDKPEIGGDAA